MSIKKSALWILNLIEWFIGVKFDKQHLNTRNSFDAIMIILATWFIFPIYSGYLDVFAMAVDGNFVDKFAIEGFRFTFIISAAWLILISLFSQARLSVLKFVSLMIPGLVLGIVVTYLLTQAVTFMQGLWKLDEITLFIMTVYPLIFSYFVRSKISHFTKPEKRPVCPPAPRPSNKFQRSVYIE